MKMCCILIIAFLSCEPAPQAVRISGNTMGTTYNVALVSPLPMDQAKIKTSIDSILYIIDKVEMTTWTSSSILSKFNLSQSTEETAIPASLHRVIKHAIDVSKLSQGAFDVSVMPLVNLWGFGWKGRPKSAIDNTALDSIKPFIGYEKINLSDIESNNEAMLQKQHPQLMIDLSAIAKGYAVDVVAEYLDHLKIKNYLVEIGGEVRSKGQNDSKQSWRIGIDQPSLTPTNGPVFQQIISVSDWSVATSGDYRNYYRKDGKLLSHTIDPRTYRPIDHQLGSATIIAKNCMMSDALATACLVLGTEEAMKLVNSLDDTEAMFVERIEDGKYKAFYSDGFERFIVK